MAKNAVTFLIMLFLTPHYRPVDCAHDGINEFGGKTEAMGAGDEDSFEDLGHVVLGTPKVEGRLRILQITDLHRFPKGLFHR
jgi:hypothetical protein